MKQIMELKEKITQLYDELQENIYNAKDLDDKAAMTLFQDVREFERLTGRRLGKLELQIRLEKIIVKEDPIYTWVTDMRKLDLKEAINYCK